MNDTCQSLFFSFFRIGMFGFGGGYAILPLISHEVVGKQWATVGEFSNMLALSQMTPGPIALTAATYVGYTVAGFGGSALATFSVCLAPFAVMCLVCRFFLSVKNNPRVAGAMRFLRPAVIGLVLAAAGLLLNRQTFVDWKSAAAFAAALVLSVRFRTNPMALLAAAGLFGWLVY